MDYVMGIDLGSTSLKAVIYDLSGLRVAYGSRPTQRFHPSAEHPEWTVWQPEQIWNDTAAAAREAVAQIDDPRRIRAVAVTGMGMDGLPVAADGKWLYPLISWLDPRTAPQLQWWREHVGMERTFVIAGNPVWPINSALRMLWMFEHEPAIMQQADKWLLIEDFLNFMLCGRQVTDPSMASCTLLFDQRARGWSADLLQAAGIPRRLLCEVLPSGTLIGEVQASASQATHLPEGTPVVLGGHDHLCGALPVGAFRPGVVLDVTGTWESVLTTLSDPLLDPKLQTSGMTVQAHVARDRHAVWGGNPCADMLEWFRRECLAESASGEDAWEDLIRQLSASPPGARRVLFLPHMSGAGCPVVDAQSMGAFVGLSNRAAAADLLRAVIEGLDLQFLDIVTTMESVLGKPLERLVAVGGGTRNRFWMQNKADMAGRALEVPDIAEATPLGAAILAGIGVGLFRDEQDAFERVYRPGARYEPDSRHTQRYAELFEVYRDVYPALSPVHRRIADNAPEVGG
jgi:xylulokinase